MSSHQKIDVLKLILDAKQQPFGNEERQKTLEKVVDEMLRSRKICRPLKGQSLSGVCLEIYQEAKKQLLHTIDGDINSYNPRRESVRQWINEQLDSIFKQVLNDTRLKTLALEAQTHLPRTQQRQYLLTELVNSIQLSGKLFYPPPDKMPRDIYQLIYDDAVNRTLLYVFQKIDLYDPTRGNGKFMTWVNFRLDKIFKEIKLLNQLPKETTINEQTLDSLGQPEPSTSVFEILREFIENDPEGLFKNEAIRTHPTANFQAIFLAKRVNGQSWHEISENLGVPMTTLSSFYWRCIQRFAPKIRQYVQECA
ncbi:MAG TPA: hypothetical protein DD379_23735 [Cyanobacteria bacterium UBA11162]|nr:hypothetical protein [Cyanobacteria bacterium UBA11162]